MYRRLAGIAAAALLGLAAPALTSPLGRDLPQAPRPATVTAGQPPVTVAHRGASAYAPENTLAAVRSSATLDIPWVETDVQRTKDGKLVAVHDTTLARTTDAEQVFPGRAPWKVADFTFAEIQRLDAGGWFAPRYRGERVPTLGQLVDLLGRTGQGLLLEVKAPELYPGIEQQVLAGLRAGGWLDSGHLRRRLVVQSFSADSVHATHRLDSRVRTGFLGAPAVDDLPECAAFADRISLRHTSVTATYVEAVHRLTGAHGKPLEVFAWTVDDTPTALRMEALGVDGIISNAPDVVRDAVGRPRPSAAARP